MAFIDNYDFNNLKNESERLVLNELGRQLETFPNPVCKCNECVVDMAAIALNSVKPLYHVQLMGGFFASQLMEEKELATALREAVFNAIERVRVNPGHDIESVI